MPFSPDMSLPLKTCISGCSFAHPLDLKWLKVGFLRDSATLVCLNKVIVTLLLEAFQLCVCAVTFLYYSNCGMCFCNTVLAHYVSVCTFFCCPGVDMNMLGHFSLSLSAPCPPYFIHINHPRLFTSSILSLYFLLYSPLSALPDSFLRCLSSLNYLLFHHPSFLTAPCSPLHSPSSLLL